MNKRSAWDIFFDWAFTLTIFFGLLAPFFIFFKMIFFD